MRRILLLVAALAFSQNIFSQDQHVLDSLQKVFDTSKNDTVRIKIIFDISWLYVNSDLDKMKLLSDSGLSLSEESNWNFGKAKGHIINGIYFTITGNYPSALSEYLKTQKIRESMNDEKGVAAVLNNIGNVHLYMANYPKALDYYLQSVKIEERYGDKVSIGEGYMNVGGVFYEMGKFEQALEYFQKYIQLSSGVDNPMYLPDANFNIGRIYSERKDYTTAMNYFNQALQLAKPVGNKQAEANAYSGIGDLWLDKNQLDSAAKYFKNSALLQEEMQNNEGLTVVLNKLGDIYAQQHKFKDALEVSSRSLKIAKDIGAKNSIKFANLALANTYYGMGDYKNAHKHMELYAQYSDSVLNEKSTEQIAEMKTRFETEKKEAENKILSEENKVKDLTIAKQNNERIFLFALMGLILIVVWFGYSRYKLKQKEILNKEILRQKEIRSKSVVEAEERERQRIGKDLHDGVGQLLSAAKMNMSQIQNLFSSPTPEQKTVMTNSVELIDEAVKEVRSISHNMMPNMLIKSGLAKAVREFIDRISSTGLLKAELQIIGLDQRLEPQTENILFRVLQEIVSNIIKHAKANHVSIQLIRDEKEISMMIEDNGVGFDTNKINDFDGIGLKNIQSRIEFLNGRVDFDSQVGRGTIVNIEVPV